MAKRTVEVALSTSGLDAQGRPIRRPLTASEQGNVLTMEPPLPMEPDPSSQLYLPPSKIDELSEPFGNSVNQTRSGS